MYEIVLTTVTYIQREMLLDWTIKKRKQNELKE